MISFGSIDLASLLLLFSPLLFACRYSRFSALLDSHFIPSDLTVLLKFRPRRFLQMVLILISSDWAVLVSVALGVDVYFPVQRCARIFAAQIYSKGCDASDEFNEEVPEHLQDYSDDEEEQRARTTSKKAKRKRSAQRAAEATIGQRQVVEYDEFATESLAGPPSRDPPPKIQKTSTSISVQEILDKNTEGELTRTNDTESADVVGFFEPLPMDETSKIIFL